MHVCVCVCARAYVCVCVCVCVCVELTALCKYMRMCENACSFLPNPCIVNMHILSWKLFLMHTIIIIYLSIHHNAVW